MSEVKHSISMSDLKKSNGRLLGYLRYGGIYKESTNNDLAILVHIRGMFLKPVPYHLDQRKVYGLIESLESIEESLNPKDIEKFEKTLINSKMARSGIGETYRKEK